MADAAGAEKILEAMSSQIDLLTSLSVGICAGIAALFIQIAIHNRSGDAARLRLQWKNALFIAFAAEGVSLVFGYLSYGAITAASPAILSLKLDATKMWTEHAFPNAATIRCLLIAQFGFFIAGVVSVFACLLKNRRLLD